MIRFGFIFIFIGSFSSYFTAQDIHFAQSAQVPTIINPANAGLFQGWERVILNHRQQWTTVQSPYVTTNGSLEFNIGKPENHDKAQLLFNRLIEALAFSKLNRNVSLFFKSFMANISLFRACSINSF